jgi:hypothetical protein
LRPSETKQSKGQFELEALEARVLLSGSDVLLASASLAAASHSHPLHHPAPILVEQSPIAETAAFQERVSYNSSSRAGDIFEGVSAQALPAAAIQVEHQSSLSADHSTAATSTAKTAPASPPAQGSQPVDSGDSAAVETQAQVQSETVTLDGVSRPIFVSKASTPTHSNSGSASVMTMQLTKSLKVANGPPVASATASQTTLANSQVYYSQSLKTNSSVAANNTGVGVSSSTATASSSKSSPTTTKTNGSNSLTDLGSVLDSELDQFISGVASGTVTITPGDVSLGGVLALKGLSVTFSNISVSGSTVTGGTVTLTADSASLTIGSAVTSTINTISGSYSIGNQQFSLSFGKTNLAVSSFLTVDASGASVTYSRATDTSITVTDGTTTATKTASLLTVGFSGVTIFAGINGPATNSGATGLKIENASLALAVFSATDGSTYYAFDSSAGSISPVGLPSSITVSATDLAVQVNSGTDGNNAVDFTQLTGGKLTVATGSSSSLDLTFTGKLLQAKGTLELNLSGFVYIKGSMALQMGSTTTVTLTDGTTTSTKTVNVLTLGASDVTIFAGVNGPSTETDAAGIELADANFALALFTPVTGSDTSVYYALKSSAGSLSPVGLPDSVKLSAGKLAVEINGSTDGNRVVDFTQFAGGKLTVTTGPTQTMDLNFSQSFLKVAGTLTMGVTDYITIGGSFSFVKTGNEVDIEVGHTAFDSAQDVTLVLGKESDPFFSATGYLSMKFDSESFTILAASLTVNGDLKLASVLDVEKPSVSLSNLTIDRATGALTGTVDADGTVHDPLITISAVKASLFPGSTALTATVSPTTGGDGLGVQGSFNLRTDAFSLNLEEFHMAVGSVLTADASAVLISYDATNSDPHQQLVSIGTGAIDFESFGISGQLTNLTIYKDGFHFDSVTVTYNGDINLGSLLTIKTPSVTLTDFGMTFSGGNVSVAANGSLTLAAASTTVNLGTSFNASATDLSVTVSLAPATLGDLTVTATKLTFQFSSYVSIQATQVAINTAPDSGAAYLSIGTATATLTVSSLSLSGTASNFSIINSNGSPAFKAGTDFTVSFSATPADLDLPSWLGFNVQQLALHWTDFTNAPADFDLTLSASITSIHGLPSGIEVSGAITDAVIDFGKLANGEFPITSIGSVSGSVKGNLFGMTVNAGFVMGVVQYNADYDAVSGGKVYDSDGKEIVGGSTTVIGSTLYVGVEGGAEIPGVGGVQVYLGFSSLGPLTLFVKAEFPLLLDPDTGIAIGGFSAGVSFDTSLPAPASAFDLASATYASPVDMTIDQWKAQLLAQTTLQIKSSSGGTDLSAAYSQPLVIRAGVTLYDAYLSQESFKITGNIAIGINPSNPGTCALLMEGVATVGGSINLQAYLYIGITVQGTASTATIAFLLNMPAEDPVAQIGGVLKFGFVNSSGAPITPATVQTVTTDDGSTTFTAPTDTGIAGFYLNISGEARFTVPTTSLNADISGSINLTVTTTFIKLDLSGKLTVSYLGNLADVGGEFVLDYSDSSNVKLYGGLTIETGSGLSKLASVGLSVDGAATFEVNSTGQTQTVSWTDPNDSTKTVTKAIDGSAIFDVVVAGKTAGTYAAITFEESNQTLFTMQGGFDFRVNTSGVQIYAVINSLQIGPSSLSLTFNGWGLLIVNDQGVAAELSLQFGASIGSDPTGSSTSSKATFGVTDSPVKLNASFTLTINTTGADVLYTIPDSLPGLADGSGGNTLRSITIPRGPPQADGSIGATGPYIVITGNGSLDLVGLQMSGFFRFEVSGSSSGVLVSLVVSMTAVIPEVSSSSVSVFGALEISDAGVKALLSVQGNVGTPTDYGSGISFSGTFQVAINSTDADVTSIGGVALKDNNNVPISIPKHTYEALINGTLTLAVGGTGFSIEGTILSGIRGGVPTLEISGVLTAKVGGSTLLTMNADGALLLPTSTTVAGELALTVSGKNPLSGTGFSFDGTFYLIVNTTGTAQQVTLGAGTTTIDAGPNGPTSSAGYYVEVTATGNMVFGTASTGFLLNNGTFYLTISSTGLSVSATASLAIEVGGTPLLAVNAQAALLVSSSGLAASLVVSSGFADPNGYYYLSGAFSLQVNTTGATQTFGAVTLPAGPNGGAAGPYFQIVVGGATPGTNATLVLGSTSSSTSTALYLSGSFTLTISSSGLAVSATSTLFLNVGGTTLFSFNASGALLISSSGLAAKVNLSLATGASGNGFSFSASMSFLLELNGTGAAISTINNVAVNLPAGYYFKVVASGSLNLAGVVAANGSFSLTVSTDSVVINLNASINILGVLFGISGDAGIYYNQGQNGIVINLNLGLGGNTTNPTATIIPGVLALQGAFNLQFNTTGADHLGVSGTTAFHIALSNANVIIFGFKMVSVSMSINVSSSGVFSSTGSLSFNFFGFATLGVTYYFDSANHYWFYGRIGVRLGSSSFNIHGSLTVSIANMTASVSYYDNIDNRTETATVLPGFSMFVDGGVTAFGFTFASIGAGVQINGTSVDISVYVSVSFYFFSIGGTVHIHLGSLATVPTPPPPVLATLESDGTLQLNLGDDASARGVASLSDEDYEISHLGYNSDGTENVAVYAPGIYNQAIEYDHVRGIVAHNTSTSNTSIRVAGDVTSPVTINAGSGNNQFYLGGGKATITGSTGNDQVFGGPGGVVFHAGSGTSLFVGGAGQNTIYGGSTLTVLESGYQNYSLLGSTLTYDGNTDTLIGTMALKLVAAGSGSSGFIVSNSPLTVSLDGNGNPAVSTSVVLDGNLTLNGSVISESNGATVTLANIPTLRLAGGASANTITVNSWSGSGAVTLDGAGGGDTYRINFAGSGSFTAQVNDTGTDGTDALIVNGTGGNDILNLSAGSVSRGLQTVSYIGAENLTVNNFDGADTVNVLGSSIPTVVNGGVGTQTFNVQSIGSALTINTGTGTNSINVGLNGTLNNILGTLTVQGGGTDTLNLDDTADTTANVGTLTANSLTGVFGTGGSLNYSGIETFNLNLGSGGNALTVAGSSGVTSINSGSGSDTVNVQAVAGTLNLSTGGGADTVNVGPLLNRIKGALLVTCSGPDTLNVNDTANSAAAAGTLDGSRISGLGLGAAGIQYTAVSVLNLSLGSGGNSFQILNTNSATTTTLNSGSGSDTVLLLADSGATFINGQSGEDIINIQSTNAATTVNTGSGVNTVNLGSLAPAVGGILDKLQGVVTVVGNGSDILNADDTGSTVGKTGDLTSSILAGLAMGPGGITYSGLASLNIGLGAGNDVLVIDGTSSATTTVNGNAGDDRFQVRGTTGSTILNTGAGDNTINIGSLQPNSNGVLTGINGKVTVNGQGSADVLNVDDTGDTAGGTLIMTATTLSGLGMAANDPLMGIVYQGIVALNINLGSGADTVNLRGNTVTTTTTINTGAGANVINIGSTAGTATPGTLDKVQGLINLSGGGSDTLNVDDSGSSVAETAVIYATSLVFQDPVTINFTGVSLLNISLSQGNDLLSIVDTFTSSSTSAAVVVNGNGGDDVFSVLDTHAVATLNGGDGNDGFYIFGNSSVINLNGDAGDDSFYIFASLVATQQNTANVNGGDASTSGNTVYSYRQNAAVNIDGGTGCDTVYIFGTVADDVITVDGTHVSGAGIDVNFTNCEALVIAGLGGSDTFYIESVSVPTTIMGEGTLPIFPPGVTPPDLTGGATPSPTNNDVFYVGWRGANTPGSLAGINSTLTIQGNVGTDTVYVDDSASTAGRTFTLTGTTLNSSAMGPGGQLIYDSSDENLDVKAGAGDDSFIINGTGAAIQTTLWGGAGNDSFVVNAPLTTPLAINGDSNTYIGDTLTINGTAADDLFTVTGFTVDGAGATISYATVESLTLNGLSGNDRFTVNGDSIPTTINGGAGNDSFTVNSNPAALVLDGGDGNDSFVISGNAGTLAVSGDAGADSFVLYGNSGSLALGGGDDSDSFVVNGNSGLLSINGDAGADSFVINALSAAAVVNGGAGDDAFTVNAPLAAALTLDGGTGSGNTLVINGTAASEYYAVGANLVTVSLAPVSYSNFASLSINGNGGNDSFAVSGTSATTILNGAAGNDTFDILAISNPTILNTAAGLNAIRVGSLAPYSGGVTDLIGALLTVNGNGSDTLRVDDTGSAGAKTGTLTATGLSGLGMAGGISYSGVAGLTISLGSGGNTFTLSNTNALTTTTLNSGSGADTLNLISDSGPVFLNTQAGNDTISIQSVGAATVVDTGTGVNTVNVGSLAPLGGGVLAGIQGSLTIAGSGSDILNADDSSDALSSTGTLTPTALTGLGMGAAGITYSGLASLNIALGTAANTFAILNTASAVTSVYAGALSNTFNVRATTGQTLLYGGAGVDTFNVGSLSPLAGGTLASIAGPLRILGGGNATLNVDNTGDLNNESGALTPTTLTGLGMGTSGIRFSGLAALTIRLGAGDDAFAIHDITPSTLTAIDGGAGANAAVLTFAGDFTARNLTLSHFDTATLSVVGSFSGLFSDGGNLSSISVGGSITATAVLKAGSIDSMTVGGDLAGLLQVEGLLGSLSVQGGTPGRIVAGDIHTISAQAAYGNTVLQVVEGGIERQIQAVPVAGGAMPDSVLFAYLYDSTSASQPQLSIRVTNGQSDTSADDVRFNLALVVYSATAKFNLARVDANGSSGLGNISVEGDILTSVSQPALAFFSLPGGSRSGVVLPGDNIIGVAVRNSLPVGVIDVAGLEGIAFATLTLRSGKIVGTSSTLGSGSNLSTIQNILGSKAVLLSATDEFRVPFAEQHNVTLYAAVDGDAALDLVATFADQITDNASVTAYVRVSTINHKLSTLTAQYIRMVGDGGSVRTNASVLSLSSTGPLGDVSVGGINGLGSITAPSIFGSIKVTRGGITGIIQTTGIRIDPITGARSVVSADLGSILYNKKGQAAGVTTIYCAGALTGQIISRGNLISSITVRKTFGGVIAAQGDVGVLARNAAGSLVASRSGQLTRFGGIAVSGNATGQILALGNILGNVAISGVLSGRIAAAGQALSGLDASRCGILGNLRVRSVTAGGAVVSGGIIGDAASKTVFSGGRVGGIVAAKGSIASTRSTKVASGNLFQNTGLSGNVNGPVITALFSNSGGWASFDLLAGDLQGLASMEANLSNLHVVGGSLAD